MYISAGISLWRLIEHDFSSADGGPNLKPALQVLYSLALAQGVLFGYKTIHALGTEFGLAEFVTKLLDLEDKDVVSDYLKDTVAGCEKDPSFATGRNLVTYAVDLMMDAKSNGGFIDGVKILGTTFNRRPHWEVIRRQVLAKHLLIRSTFSSYMFQRLLDTLMGAISPDTEIREQAASIVEFVASSIHLEQYPGCIECISSLFHTFEEYSLPKEYGLLNSPVDSNDLQDSYRRLVKQGLIILQKLTVHEDNCRIITNTEGLLLKITAPALISKQLHRDHHDVWSDIAEDSSQLIKRLVINTLGNTRAKLLGSEKAIIGALKSILECLECQVRLKRRVVETLLYLSVDTSSITASESSARRFTWILVLLISLSEDSFGDKICRSTHLMDITRLAGDKLLGMLSSNQELSAMLPLQQSNEGSARIMLQSFQVVLGDITRALVDAGNISNRVHAAQVLYYLCANDTKNAVFLEELKKFIVHVMPEVLKEILGYGLTSNVRPAVMDANNVTLSLDDIDIESRGVPQGNGQENASSSQQQTGEQPEDTELWKALVSLCKSVWSLRWRWYIEDSALTHQLDEIAAQVCSELGKPAEGFIDLVKESEELMKKKKAEQSASAPAS